LQISGNTSGSPLDATVSIRSESTVVQLSVQPVRTSTGAPNMRIQECSVTSAKPVQLQFTEKQMTDKQKALIQVNLK
jgi:hypothetical protein